MIFTDLSEGHLNQIAKIFEIDLIAHFLLSPDAFGDVAKEQFVWR